MKIVPSRETRGNGARRSETRPPGHISNKVLITRVIRDAPEIKIMKTNHKVKMEEISTRTCLCKEEFMKDTYQGTPKPAQPEDATISATMAPKSDEALQQILNLKTCFDRLKKQVAKLQTMLETKKDQSLDELEREKPNTTHTKHNLNPWNVMKDRSNDKSDYKGGAGAHNWRLKDEEQTYAPCAARDHYKEGQPPNTDAKSSLENLVSEDLQTGQDNRLTKRLPRAVNEEGQSQTTPSSSKAPKMSPNLEPIAWDADVASLLTPRRPSFEMRGH